MSESRTQTEEEIKIKKFAKGWKEEGDNTERLIFFTDAVIAIALTLLVIDLRVPEIADKQKLPEVLSGLFPNLLGVIISFFVISLLWRAHHRNFQFIERYDQTLIFLNTLFLLAVILEPFVTALISRYENEQISVILYAAIQGWAILLLTLQWAYAAYWRKLVIPELEARVARLLLLRTLIPGLIFLISMWLPLLIKPSLVPFFWLLILPEAFILKRLV